MRRHVHITSRDYVFKFTVVIGSEKVREGREVEIVRVRVRVSELSVVVVVVVILLLFTSCTRLL